MSQFVDRALLQLHDPAALAALLKGGGAAPYPGLERLLTSVFDPSEAAIDHVQDLTVSTVAPMVWMPGRDRLSLTWTATQPAPGLGDLRGELTRSDTGAWAHLMARVSLTVVVSRLGTGIDSVSISSLDDITSFADFESRFRYIDLPAFLAANKITTVDELRDAGPYLLAEIQLAQLPPFDPVDPANSVDVELDLAAVVLDDLDLAAGLTAARQLWHAGTSQPPGPRSALLGETVRPFAVAVVFPESSLGGGQPSAAAVDSLYATAQVLSLFANPP